MNPVVVAAGETTRKSVVVPMATLLPKFRSKRPLKPLSVKLSSGPVTEPRISLLIEDKTRATTLSSLTTGVLTTIVATTSETTTMRKTRPPYFTSLSILLSLFLANFFDLFNFRLVLFRLLLFGFRSEERRV